MEPPWEPRLLVGAHSMMVMILQYTAGGWRLRLAEDQVPAMSAEWPETWFLSVSPPTDSGWYRLLPELTFNFSFSHAQHGFCDSMDFSIFCFGQVVHFQWVSPSENTPFVGLLAAQQQDWDVSDVRNRIDVFQQVMYLTVDWQIVCTLFLCLEYHGGSVSDTVFHSILQRAYNAVFLWDLRSWDNSAPLGNFKKCIIGVMRQSCASVPGLWQSRALCPVKDVIQKVLFSLRKITILYWPWVFHA